MQLDTQFEPAKQIAIADRIVITKSDRAPTENVAKLEARIRALNKSGEILQSVLGDAPSSRLFGLGAHEPALAGSDPRQWLAIEPHETDAHPHPHGHDHHHDHTCGPDCGHDHDHDDGQGHVHHDPAHLHGISSFALTFDKELDGSGLSLGLQTMAASYGDKLLRVKGIVSVQGQSKPFVVHGVQHVFYPPDVLKDWPKAADGTPDKRSRFVFITKDLPRATIEKHLKPFIGEANA
jgi:G3E family GTPase